MESTPLSNENNLKAEIIKSISKDCNAYSLS